MAKRKSQYEQLKEDAKSGGLFVARWAPGDGVTRYKFFDKPGNDYFGPGNGICTALGIGAAYKFLQTGSCPRGKVRRPRREPRRYSGMFGGKR